MSWTKTKISEFLFERKGKYKPQDGEIQGLQRVEKIDFKGNFHIGDKSSKTNMIIAKKGDLVISGINVAKGAMGIYTGEEDVVATIHYSSYTFDKAKINVDYFKRFLKSPEFIILINEQVKGGIKTEIKPKHILPLEINIPDIDTQNKIVANFEKIEDDITELDCEVEYQQNLLIKLKQSILQEAIKGKLTSKWREQNLDIEPASVLLEKIQKEKEQLIKEKKIKKLKLLAEISEDEMSFEIPSSWEWCRLEGISFGFEYGTSSKSDKDGKIPVLRMGNIQNGKVIMEDFVYTNNEDEIEKYMIKHNDILFNRTNSREKVGKTAIYDFIDKVIYAGYLVKFTTFGEINSKYINFYMNSPTHREWCNKVKSDAIGQSNINATKLKSFITALPPKEEQDEIVNKIEKLFTICDELEEQINSSKQNTQTLMQAVLKEAFEN